LTQFVTEHFKLPTIPEELEDKTGLRKAKKKARKALHIVKRTIKSVLAAISLMFPQMNRLMKTSFKQGE